MRLSLIDIVLPSFRGNSSLNFLQAKYMGIEKTKRKIRKMNEKKFVFDWDAQEDTSTDINPLYQQKHQTTMLFGRGHIAGIDIKEQKKTSSTYYQDLLDQRRTEEERQRIKCVSLGRISFCRVPTKLIFFFSFFAFTGIWRIWTRSVPRRPPLTSGIGPRSR
jgi:hypothetical protein